MYRTVKTVATITGVIICGTAFGKENVVSLSSPDGLLNITFRTVENTRNQSGRRNAGGEGTVSNVRTTERLVYEISYKSKPLMEHSAMGLELEGSRVLGECVGIVGRRFSEGTDEYRLITGRVSSVRERYNAVTIETVEECGSLRRMNVEARAYNDAVAFRYVVPEQKSMTEYRLKSEKTEYRLAKDAVSYALVLPNFRSGYESEFQKVPVTGLSNQGGVASYCLVGMPLLLEMYGVGWVTIAEADIEGNAATYLRNPSGSWAGHWFESVMSPSLRDGELAVVGGLPHRTAWRVVMVAPEPTHFMMSNTLTNLNPECRIADVSWIRPGKSAWDWWNGSLNAEGEHAYTTETMKYYIDFAAGAGLEYMTVDAGWSGSDITVCRDNVNVPEVVAYARSKGVKVVVWVGGTNVWRMMDEAFPLYEKWGVAGLKIDFILRDDQAGVEFYYRVAEKAAKHRLLVDFHGCTKPWGLQRTYPNVVGFEAVLGMENSLVGVRDTPENRLVTPFTRMIGGLLDYTPGAFENVTREEFEARNRKPVAMGTRAHHLAMYVVYESPFQMVSDWPERYRNDSCFEWIRMVPSSWDRSVALNGYPGEYLTVARKKGDDWYLGAMTNRAARSYEVSLDFLDSGVYEAVVFADAPDSDRFPKKTVRKTLRVTPDSRFKIEMTPDGGMAARLRKL
jgi:alpha-glucosidase